MIRITEYKKPCIHFFVSLAHINDFFATDDINAIQKTKLLLI